MARKLVLEGPAAAAVERLARQAAVSPAELVKRALRREDEAQRQRDEVVARQAAASRPQRLVEEAASRAGSGAEGGRPRGAGAAGSGSVSYSRERPDSGKWQSQLPPEDRRRDEPFVIYRARDNSIDFLAVHGIVDGDQFRLQMPYPEPGVVSFPFRGGHVTVDIPPQGHEPTVRFEREAEGGEIRGATV